VSRKTRLFYDIGELGWSMYLAAHLKHLHRRDESAAIAVSGAREVFYRDCTREILPLPEEWSRHFGRYPADGTHLYNPRTGRRIRDHQLLSEPFRRAYPDHEVVTTYSRFEGKRIFEPYRHSPHALELCRYELGEAPVILIFPRRRGGKFRGRNVPRRQWDLIAGALCEAFSDCLVVALGSANGAWRDLRVSHSGFRNMVGWNDRHTLDMMVALSNTRQAIAAVGNQSGTVKMTLLGGTPTYIFGHERERHTVTENWARTEVGFWEVTSRIGLRPRTDSKANLTGYRIGNLPAMIDEILLFITAHR